MALDKFNAEEGRAIKKVVGTGAGDDEVDAMFVFAKRARERGRLADNLGLRYIHWLGKGVEEIKLQTWLRVHGKRRQVT